MLGLVPVQTAVVPPRRGQAVPVTVVEVLAHLKALYTGVGYRELARILWHTTHERIDDKTVKKLWQQLPGPGPGPGALPPDHAQPSQGRLDGLLGHKPGPQAPRTVWCPLMVEV